MPTGIRTPGLKDLRSEIRLLGDEFPRLREDDLFVAWFLFAFVTGSKESAVSALTGPSADKAIDAIHIDHKAKLATVVQGKYRTKLMASAESRAHVLEFAALAQKLAAPNEAFLDFTEGLEGAALAKLKDARDAVLNRGYRLNLHYATLGRCSRPLADEARRLVRSVDIPAVQRPRLTILSGRQVISVLADYLDGVAPPVPSVELALEGKPQEKFDEKTDVSSWTFSVNGSEVARLVDQYGVKLFARNIRGYLGETGINTEIRRTLQRDPRSFWYLNNGITVVCDGAVSESAAGYERLSLSNPQIINGQQTSYALHAEPRGAARAEVSMRVISVPKGSKADDFATYDEMVNRIVESTNSQNKIKASDLRSNDRVQVSLERDLHQLGYYYQRKRAAASEVARSARQHEWKVSKESLAKAVAGCEDAAIVSRGVDLLFEEPRYARIFKHPARQLLCRWWLSRAVGRLARGSTERQAAKSVVLQFLWQELGSAIKASQASFIDIFENEGNDRRHLVVQSAIRHSFAAVLSYYRKERGRGRDRVEVIAFFKRQDIFKGFEQFFSSSKKGLHATRFENAARRLAVSLERPD
jgi:hypothetical protein